jgi:peptide/nickel transport system permease protein
VEKNRIMRKFLITRILYMILTLIVFITLCFFLFRLLPGDPTALVISPILQPEYQAVLKAQFGLDKPLYIQYCLYFKNLMRGGLGISFIYRAPVIKIIRSKIFNTLILMGLGMTLCLIIGILGGTVMAWLRGSKLDSGLIIFSLAFRSTPIFWSGMLILLLFGYKLGWFPVGRMHTPGYDAFTFWGQYFNVDFLKHLILPLSTLTLYYLASPLLVMRNSMLEVLHADFVELAIAKGLHPLRVMYHHAARNALLPVVTLISLMVGYSVGGQVLLETIFSWPGMGKEIVDAVNSNDYPMAQGAFLFLGATVISMNFIADVLYCYLDPRIKYGEE